MLIYVVLISTVLFAGFNLEYAQSCLLGGAFMLFNLLGLYALWKIIFSKKSIALAVLVIILKYSILGYLLWLLPKIHWLVPTGFVIGISTLVLGILTTVLLKKFFIKSYN